MKKITLPKVVFGAEPVDGEVQTVGCATQLRVIVSTAPPPTSFSLQEIRERLPIVEKIEAVEAEGGQILLLEDAEHAVVLAAVQAAQWSGVSRQAVELVEAVEKAEAVDVTQPNP